MICMQLNAYEFFNSIAVDGDVLAHRCVVPDLLNII